MKCGHCGNIANCKSKALYTHIAFNDDTYQNEDWTWHLLQCPACSGPILIISVADHHDQSKIIDDPTVSSLEFINGLKYSGMNAYSTKMKVLYPLDETIETSPLPYKVGQAYQAALKVQKVEPNAFAVLVGRTIEVICYQEKASGKVLADKIKNLADTGRIPQVLADMAKQLKQLRNLGAHADSEDEITKEDVPTIREFIDAILEYLYIAPNKIKKLEERLHWKENFPF